MRRRNLEFPNFLADRGVNVIISDGMGGCTVDIFNERNVEVVVGDSGNARLAVEKYLKGELKRPGLPVMSANITVSAASKYVREAATIVCCHEGETV